MENNFLANSIDFTHETADKFIKLSKAYVSASKRKANGFNADTLFNVVARRFNGYKYLALVMYSNHEDVLETVVLTREDCENDGNEVKCTLNAGKFIALFEKVYGGIVVEPTGEGVNVYRGELCERVGAGDIPRSVMTDSLHKFTEMPIMPSIEAGVTGKHFARMFDVSGKGMPSQTPILFNVARGALEVVELNSEKYNYSSLTVDTAKKSEACFIAKHYALVARLVKLMKLGDSNVTLEVHEDSRGVFMVVRDGVFAIRVDCEASDMQGMYSHSILNDLTHVGLISVQCRELDKALRSLHVDSDALVQLVQSGNMLAVGTPEDYVTLPTFRSGTCRAQVVYKALREAVSQMKQFESRGDMVWIKLYSPNDNSGVVSSIKVTRPNSYSYVETITTQCGVLGENGVPCVDFEWIGYDFDEVVDAETVADAEPVTQDVEPVKAEPTQDTEPETPTVALAKPTPIEPKQIPAKQVERVEPVKPHALTVTAPAGVPAKGIPELAGMGHAKAFRDLKGRKLAYVASDGKRCVVVWRDWYKRDDKELVSRVVNYVTSLGFVA